MSLEAKATKLYEARFKFQGELEKVQKEIEESVQKKDLKVERLVNTCEEQLTAAVSRNDELLHLARNLNESDTVKAELETWLKELTSNNDRFLSMARQYIDSLDEEPAVLETSRNLDSSPQKSKSTTSKAQSSVSKKSSAVVSSQSKTSSKRKKELLLAKMRREEKERKNEAALRLQETKNRLVLLELEESNRQRLAEATMEEAELEDVSEVSEILVDPDLALSETRDQDRISNWVQNTSTADVNTHVTAELENFPNTFDNLSVAGTSHFNQPQAPLMNNPPINNQSLQLSANCQTNPVSLNLPTPPPLVNMTVTPLTQPIGMKKSIVNPVGTDPTVQVVPLLPPIAMSSDQSLFNGTISAPPAKSTIVNYTPNLASWNFSIAPQTALTQKPVTTAATSTNAPTIATTYVPVPQGGIVYPSLPVSSNSFTGAVTNSNLAHLQTCVPPQSMQTSQQGLNTHLTIKDLAELLTISRKDPLPEWKLDKYDGNPLNWHEWYGQFRSAVDSTQLSQDVKLTYLKTLVTGKAKTAIANFAYCGAMYTEALKTLEKISTSHKLL